MGSSDELSSDRDRVKLKNPDFDRYPTQIYTYVTQLLRDSIALQLLS